MDEIPNRDPWGSSSFISGTIAASTPQNIIWAPSSSNQPYYTLNGGTTWNPITLPGVSSWSGFDFAWYLDQRSVTADRVLANTFYLYDPGHGVFETSNGGVELDECPSGLYRRQLFIRRLEFDAHVRPRRGRRPFLYGRTVGHSQLHAGK